MKKKQILHIVSDEKFIDMAYREFEVVAPGQNKMIIIGEERPLRYIKKAAVSFLSLRQARNIVAAEDCAAVILHSFSARRLLPNVPANKAVIWLGLGYDYYDRLLSREYPDGLMLPGTLKLVQANRKSGGTKALNFVDKAKKVIVDATIWGLGINDKKILSRVDYFAPVLESEYAMATKLNPWFRPEYLEWNYGTVEDDLGGSEPTAIALGENILVGNSADPWNNHLEAFEYLDHNVDMSVRKVVTPLSYGEDWYRKKVIEIGEQRFGDKFLPLVSFMDNKAYIELLQSCGFVFMNHLRQQAVANVCIMMLKGAKIYFNPKNPAYKWFLEKGCAVESSQTLCRSGGAKKVGLTALNQSQREVNAQFVKSHWGRDAQRAKTRRLIDVALGHIE